ncbi:hypothetical protein ES703_89910 [subsurface metagenome]
MNLKNKGISGEIPSQKVKKKELIRSESINEPFFIILQQNYKN